MTETATNRLQTVTTVIDKVLRGILIAVATNIENMLKNGTAQTDTPFKTETPYGLRIDVLIEYRSENKPIIFIFEYQMDPIKFQKYLKEHPELCEGAIAFIGKGIEIIVPFGAEKYDKSGFSIRGKDGEQIFFDLLNTPVKFRVHRDVFAQQEWEVFIDEI